MHPSPLRVAGIIAEYNPFHCGHAYHIQQTKELTHADYVIVVMSGDFTQRGMPAIFDKYLRTEMALRSSADLVIELPNAFATSSAEDFAACGTALLDKLGVVSHLCFGSEFGDIAPFTALASWFLQEDSSYSAKLKEYLKSGHSFPAARELAFSDCISDITQESHSALRAWNQLDKTANSSQTNEFAALSQPDEIANLSQPDEIAALFQNPNNILALEYCKALLKRNSHIQPVTIKRQGMGYHDSLQTLSEQTLSEQARLEQTRLKQTLSNQTMSDTERDSVNSAKMDSLFHSATSIRQILTSVPSWETMTREQMAILQTAVPSGTLACIKKGHPITPDALTPYLNYKLLTSFYKKEDLCLYADVSSELKERLWHYVLSPVSFEERIFQLKTKQYTYTRISRALLHILLNTTKASMELWKSPEVDFAPYARVLGFQKTAAPLLKEIKRHSSIPLITRPKEAYKLLSSAANTLFEQDIFASHFYQALAQATYHIPVKNEYQAGRELLGFVP